MQGFLQKLANATTNPLPAITPLKYWYLNHLKIDVTVHFEAGVTTFTFEPPFSEKTSNFEYDTLWLVDMNGERFSVLLDKVNPKLNMFEPSLQKVIDAIQTATP